MWRDVTTALKAKDVTLATEHKHGLEQEQREAAKERKESGEQWQTKVGTVTAVAGKRIDNGSNIAVRVQVYRNATISCNLVASPCLVSAFPRGRAALGVRQVPRQTTKTVSKQHVSSERHITTSSSRHSQHKQQHCELRMTSFATCNSSTPVMSFANMNYNVS